MLHRRYQNQLQLVQEMAIKNLHVNSGGRVSFIRKYAWLGLYTLQNRRVPTKVAFTTNTKLGNIHVHVFEVEHIRMSNVLHRLVRFHPLAPRERGHSIDSRSVHSPHSHVVVVERRRSHLAIDSSEVSRAARVQIVSRGNDLRGIPPIRIRGADFPQPADRAGSRWSAESSRNRRGPSRAAKKGEKI